MANLFEIKMTREEIIDGLRSQYGSEFTTPEVRAWCAMNDITYQTVTKKLKEFKVTKGKWNLEVTQEVVEDIERSFAAPAASPAVVAPVVQNLIPELMRHSLSLAHLLMSKRLFNLSYSILHSLQDCQVMVRHSLLSKHVHN